MSQDLQNLIEKIKKEALEGAESQANAIISKAKEESETIVAQAQQQAKAFQEQAQKEATLLQERAQATMQQAARDVLISIGQNLEKMILGLVEQQTKAELGQSLLQEMVLKITQVYANNSISGEAQMLLSKEDVELLGAFAKKEFEKVLKEGVTVQPSAGVKSGFQIRLNGSQVSHEFTGDAIVETLSDFLRPQLSQVVRKAAQSSVAQ